MKRFAKLYTELDSSTSTLLKQRHLVRYFSEAEPADAAWAVYFLCGGKPKRILPTALMRQAACELAGVSEWLFEESYQAVGDLAETIAHILPPPEHSMNLGLSAFIESQLLPLRQYKPPQALATVKTLWASLDALERFLFVKLVGGGFRVGVSKLLVTKALAQFSGLDASDIAQRLMGYTESKKQVCAADFSALVSQSVSQPNGAEYHTSPYPFFLAHSLQSSPDALGACSDWLAEWKFDGIRGQVVKRGGEVRVWSRGEELLNDQFPELVLMAKSWPDGCVLDGEILVSRDNHVASFSDLQTRLGRKRVDVKLQTEYPVVFMAYDALQIHGEDIRQHPQQARRKQLEQFFSTLKGTDSRLQLSEVLLADTWQCLHDLRAQSRTRGVEGLMLKHREAAYGAGRTKADGVWWKWKLEPMSIDAVLVYAQRGHGRRASLYTDYTFAVWEKTPDVQQVAEICDAIAKKESMEQSAARGLPRLVTFAKAYSGLTDEDFKRVDQEIKKRSVEKFGPVRSVVPSMVFELGFEGIALSGRHKSGVAVRFPRMLRIRDDKTIAQANTLADLQALLLPEKKVTGDVES